MGQPDGQAEGGLTPKATLQPEQSRVMGSCSVQDSTERRRSKAAVPPSRGLLLYPGRAWG
jgi:hypothetical protein